MDPSTRVQIVSQIVLGITPGSRQPVDLASFLHPIADELNTLAAGVRGVSVVGCTEPQVVHAFVIQITTDMPAGDKLINAIGGNGESPGRFRLFSGVWHMTRYYLPPYAPDDQPPSKHRCFAVMGRSTPQRTASIIAVGVKIVEDARAAGKIKSAVRMIARHEGFTGYSLFFCPSPDDRKRDLAIRYMWEIGPDLAPYGTMHLFLSNVVPVLWGLCCGDKDKLGGDQPWDIASAACEAVGREIKAGRPTVPLSQARSLWNINKNSSSFKAVDWMYSLLSIGAVVLADRISEEIFRMFMLLCQAGRVLFKISAMTTDEQKDVDKHLRLFCSAFCTHVYAGKEERLRACRPTVVALLDVAANLRSCGPASSFWQCPAERLIGTLSRLIRSRRFPYAALTDAITSRCTTELVTSYAEGHLSRA